MLQEIFKFSTEILRSLKDKAGKKNQSLFRTLFIFELLILYPPHFFSSLFHTPLYFQVLISDPGTNPPSGFWD